MGTLMIERPTASIRWLHLSDLHVRAFDWSQDVVLASLQADVAKRYRGLARPDLIFITGDIAFSGKPEQYVNASALLTKISTTLEVPPHRVFLVPGNHDIDRSLEEDAFVGARATLTTQEHVD